MKVEVEEMEARHQHTYRSIVGRKKVAFDTFEDIRNSRCKNTSPVLKAPK